MRQTGYYAIASLALGLICYFGSEAFFWSFRPEAATLPDIAMTVAAYSLAAACALSAVAWSGCGGLTGAFLGGAVVGFIVEGVVVSTMYDAFPFQLVWTPLAWHALVTGCAIFALHRAAVGWSIGRQAAAMLALGLFGGVFAAYWPIERPTLPDAQDTAVYLIGTGLGAVVGFVVLDRIQCVPTPPRVVRWVVPVLTLFLFVVLCNVDPRPQRIAWPVLIALTLWAMDRLGQGGRVSFGPPAPIARHLMFLIAPLVTAVIAAGFVAGTEGFGTNTIVAATTVPLGLGWYLWLLWRAYRARAATA